MALLYDFSCGTDRICANWIVDGLPTAPRSRAEISLLFITINCLFIPIAPLPFFPDHQTIVRVPAGTCILNRIAGPILGNFSADPLHGIPTPGPWGAGGVEQIYTIGTTPNLNCQGAVRLPLDSYINQQPINANFLWYAPVVGGGNAGAVASYLDHLPAPTPFGDLDGIYNTLDLMNFGDPAPLREAMNELSGEAYTGLQSVAKLNSRFSEHDAGDVNLAVQDGRVNFLRSGLGARASFGVDLGGFRITPEVYSLWSHDFLDENPQITARFTGAPSGSTFVVYGARPSADYALLGAGITAAAGDRLSFFANHDGELRGGLNAHSVTAGLRLQW